MVLTIAFYMTLDKKYGYSAAVFAKMELNSKMTSLNIMAKQSFLRAFRKKKQK